MKCKMVKIPITKSRYVKVMKFEKAFLVDGMMQKYAVMFVRWSKKYGKLIIVRNSYSVESMNAMLNGVYSLENQLSD